MIVVGHLLKLMTPIFTTVSVTISIRVTLQFIGRCFYANGPISEKGMVD